MKLNGRTSQRVHNRLDFRPIESSYSGAQGLGRGLLGRKPSRKLWYPATTVGLFAGCVDAAQEAIPEPINQPADALDLHQIHAHREQSYYASEPRSTTRATRCPISTA